MNLEIILNTIFYSIFLMKVIETIQINVPDSKICNTLKSPIPENYIPAVQSSIFSGNGQGATRGC